eukprot:9493592-Pyramimonas_sp.AAC.1
MGAAALFFAHLTSDNRKRVQQLAQLAPDAWGGGWLCHQRFGSNAHSKRVEMTVKLEQLEGYLSLGLSESARQKQRRCAPTPLAALWPALSRKLHTR